MLIRGLLLLVALCAPFDLSGIFMINCDCTDLVVWGEYLHSNVGGPRLSPLVSSMVSLPPYIKGIVVGLVLADARILFPHSRTLNCPNFNNH